jgi:hypothetical protein
VSFLDTAKEGKVCYQAAGGDDLNVDNLLQKIKSDLHPGQLDFVNDSSTEILGLSAGYGAGKTRSLCAKTVSIWHALTKALRDASWSQLDL